MSAVSGVQISVVPGIGRQVVIPLPPIPRGSRYYRGRNFPYAVDPAGPTWRYWLTIAEPHRKGGERLTAVHIGYDQIQYSFRRAE